MSFLRFLMLLSLVVWIGGLIFFAFVLAPTAFTVLPTTHLAGNVVGRALGKLHWIAIFSGIVYLISSLLYSRLTDGTAHVFAARHVLLCLMLGAHSDLAVRHHASHGRSAGIARRSECCAHRQSRAHAVRRAACVVDARGRCGAAVGFGGGVFHCSKLLAASS